ADLFARRVFALHAGNRLEDRLRIAGGIAREVPGHPQPVHLAPFRDLGLAHDGHVVFALAGRPARVAADAGVGGDRPPPLVPLIVGVRLPEGEVFWFLLEDAERPGLSFRRSFGLSFVRAFGFGSGRRLRLQLRQRGFADDGTTFHAAVLLGRRDRVLPPDLG